MAVTDDGWSDDEDGLTARDFSDHVVHSDGSSLDALDEYCPVSAVGNDDEVTTIDPMDTEDDAEHVMTALFTVTNPGDTVSATALIGGRIHEITLAGTASSMTETELAEEILVIAGLATQKARAAQHAVIVEMMQSMGHDPVMLRGFLEYQIGLPTPEAVAAENAAVFATRYQRQD